MKKKGNAVAGFTLVEMIVVLAIVGVLAAILIPSMMGYTKKAKHAAANANAKALLNAGMLACREADVQKPIPPGIYTKEGGKDFDSNTIISTTMNEYIAQQFKLIDTTVWGIRVTDDVVVGACVANSTDSPYVGTYPHPNQDKYESLNQLGSFEGVLKFAETGSWN